MKLDLHIHSHVSDGRVSPAEVVHAAAAGGLDVIALTDHDTIGGIREAEQASSENGIRLIPGIEISARHGPDELHILGYWVDPDAPSMLEHSASAARQREERMRKMLARLADHEIRVSWEEVVQAAGPEARSIGRPHLARALLEAGHIRSYREAFDRYISDAGPAFVAQAFPDVGEAMRRIHAAGGVAVWAHPPLEVFDREIRHLVGMGLDGIEALRPETPPAYSLLLERAAAELGLLVTGGSDWHGPHRRPLGDFYLRAREVEAFLAAAPVGWR